MGKGARVKERNGLGCGVSEEEKRAEKDNGQKSGDEPISGVVEMFLKFW